MIFFWIFGMISDCHTAWMDINHMFCLPVHEWSNNHPLMVDGWLLDQSWMLRDMGMWFPHHPCFTPSPLICRHAPKTELRASMSIQQPSVNHTMMVFRCTTHFWWEIYLTHCIGEHLTTINAPSVDQRHWVVSCSGTAILSVMSLSVPWTEIKFQFHLRSPWGWSANPRRCPWASMIIKQPSVNHPHGL